MSIVVQVWKDGYASDNKGTLIVADDANIEAAVRKEYGSFARVYAVYNTENRPVGPQVSEEYARSISAKDNS